MSDSKNPEPKGRFHISAKGVRSAPFGFMDWGLGINSVIFWGSAPYFISEALDGMSPGSIAWFRVLFGFAAVAFLPGSRTRVSIGTVGWLRISLLGFFWIALPFTLFSLAQQWIDSSLAGMLIGTLPLFGTTIASITLKSPPSPLIVAGLIIGFSGAILTAVPNLGNADSTALGIIFVIIAVACYGLAINLVIPMTQEWGSGFVISRMLFVSSIMTAPYGIVGLFDTEYSARNIGFMAILGVGATMLAPLTFSMLGSRVGPARASSINYMVPIVALYLGSQIRHEDIHTLSLLGLGIILAGIALTSGKDTRHA